jgi:hypothetical protein
VVFKLNLKKRFWLSTSQCVPYFLFFPHLFSIIQKVFYSIWNIILVRQGKKIKRITELQQKLETKGKAHTIYMNVIFVEKKNFANRTSQLQRNAILFKIIKSRSYH